MQTINLHAAKTHLSHLVDAAAGGEEIVIAKAGKPMARLVPLEGKGRIGERPFGLGKDAVWISDDFDEPLDEEFERAFRGEAP
jgi:prevent-host-death family protein